MCEFSLCMHTHSTHVYTSIHLHNDFYTVLIVCSNPKPYNPHRECSAFFTFSKKTKTKHNLYINSWGPKKDTNSEIGKQKSELVFNFASHE